MDLYKSEIIDPNDEVSRLAKEVCFESHRNCPAVTVVPHQPNNFRGPVGFVWKKHILQQMMQHSIDPQTGAIVDWTMLEEVENDGAGGKPQFFTLAGTPDVFESLGWEIITMTKDDFSRSGRFAVVIDNEMNVKRVTAKNLPLIAATFQGYGRALHASRLINITGETAILKHSVTAFCDRGTDEQFILTWGASCIGLAHRDLLLDGSRIKPGMVIVGFWEPGYRCNGGTFFTNLIIRKFGPEISQILASPKAVEFARRLTVPSLSYSNTITRVLGWNPDGSINVPYQGIAGIAHITGGGVWEKLKDLLPEGVGALLDKMPEPAPILREAQEMSWDTNLRLTDRQAYGTLHGGCGMLLVCVDEFAANYVIKEAEADGIKAFEVGTTTASDANKILIYSRFKEGSILSSDDQ